MKVFQHVIMIHIFIIVCYNKKFDYKFINFYSFTVFVEHINLFGRHSNFKVKEKHYKATKNCSLCHLSTKCFKI